MTNLQALETQLLSLKPTEQVAIIRMLSQNLATDWEGISKTPGVMGGEACIRNTRISVWLLTRYRCMGLSNNQIIANYPDLTELDLTNAWAYAELYPEEIAVAVARQDAE